jgi:uncharacterized protein (TIGR03032 family)
MSEEATQPPLRSVHTASFPPILEQLGISVLVSTYQAGKLVALRAHGGVLNTHFRTFSRPMGMAVHQGRLAIGTSVEIWEYHNVPAVSRRLEGDTPHDACFLPRSALVTGDIQIHEMAWATGTQSRSLAHPRLVFVNTRFSCLCIGDAQFSFVPIWRPSFVTKLAPEDRCHLNGLGMVDGQPAYVTALGVSDESAGWRANKKSGGILIDLSANEIIARGLSMPHSPRWYAGRLWVLESGAGGLGIIDLNTGKYECVATLPGFTRGLDFYGNYAFIGLSQVRETNVFSGIAIAERPLSERNCGVWVVDITSGQTVAFVRFEDALQEIFAVSILEGIRNPDIVNDDASLISDSFVLPDEALHVVPDELRSPNTIES